MEYVKEYNGKTVLLITHDIEEHNSLKAILAEHSRTRLRDLPF